MILCSIEKLYLKNKKKICIGVWDIVQLEKHFPRIHKTLGILNNA